MQDFFIGVIVTLVGTAIIGVFSILFAKPYKRYSEIYKEVLKLKGNYDEPRKLFSSLGGKSMAINNIEKQQSEILNIVNEVQEQIELHPYYSKLFKYYDLRSSLYFLFEYNRNPIMLPKDKEFEDDYRMDLDKFFDGLIKNIKFPLRKVIIISVMTLVVAVILTFFIYQRDFENPLTNNVNDVIIILQEQ